VRVVLTATESGAGFTFVDEEGNSQLKITSSDAGLSVISMYDKAGGEKIGISLDDKGTHVHLAGTGKQESYLFLKNSGASELVLTDSNGNRRLEAKVCTDANLILPFIRKTGIQKNFNNDKTHDNRSRKGSIYTYT
jgi:hypothetical protein